MQIKLVLVFLLGIVRAERRTYNGYVVYKVTPKTDSQLNIIMSFNEKNGFDFWSNSRDVNQPIRILVAPEVLVSFTSALKIHDISFEVLIENFEDVLVAEDKELKTTKSLNGSATFTSYMTYDEILAYLNTLAKDYPDTVTVETIGKTINNRDIPLIKISSGGRNKPAILIDAGIHAREWIAPALALYTINQLVENSTNGALFANVDWYIIPVLNPDGYIYTRTNDRMWRKNQKQGKICYGTDLNRNFDFHWMEVGASSNECSDTYAGTEGFSELETQAFRDFVLAKVKNIKLYLAFHSYGQYLIYPWAWTNALPDDEPTLRALATLVNAAISAVAGTTYKIGTATNVLYASAGVSDDWTKGVADIALSYTIELPGGGNFGFNPPASRILPIVTETWEGLKVYQSYVENNFNSFK